MRSDIIPGRVFPNFELLLDHASGGTLRKLSEIQGRRPADPHR